MLVAPLCRHYFMVMQLSAVSFPAEKL